MKIGFRQGIIRSARDNNGTPTFLELTSAGSYVNLNVNSSNAYKGVFITFAVGNTNYLYEEKAQIVNAWGPINSSKTTYLYWDIDNASGMVTRRTTDVPPVLYGPQPVNPLINQHWFNDTSNTMLVWNGTRWNKVIRVFAGKVENRRISYNLKECVNISYLKAKYQLVGMTNDMIRDNFTFNIIGSQSGMPFKLTQFTSAIIGSNTASAVDSISKLASDNSNSGFIMYGMDKKAVKELSTGNFMTTDTSISLNFGTFTSPIKLETANTFFKAGENMGKFSLISFNNEGRVVLADRKKQLWAAGIISHDVYEDEEILIEHHGMIYNENWNLNEADVGKTIFLDTNGTFAVEEPPGLIAQKLGVITSTKSILLTPDLIGPIGKPNDDELPRATVDTLGYVKLSLDAVDPINPIVVGDNDARLSDARNPLAHTHDMTDINNLQDVLDKKVDMITGGNVAAPLTVLYPTTDPEAANKKYVDDSLANLLLIAAPLSDLLPVPLDTVPSAGTGVEAARIDHVHPLPADVQYFGSVSGLMSVADKRKLDDLGPATNVLKQSDLGVTVAPLNTNLKLESSYLIPVNDTDNGAMTPAQKKKLDDLGDAADVIKTQDIGVKVSGLVQSLDDPNKLIVSFNNLPEAITPTSNYNAGLMGKADKITLDKLASLDSGNGDFSNILLDADIGTIIPELVNGKIPNNRIELATPTIDGLLTSQDKIKLDNLQSSFDNIKGTMIPLIDDVTPSIGTSDKYAREDHVHPITPLATQTTDGLLSKDDKIKIDNMEELTDLLGSIIPNKPIDNIGAIGTSDKLAREDHIHPLPDVVTTTTDGLMTSVDKVKLDNLNNTLTGLGATNTPLSDNGTGDVGTSNKFAREDHVHPITPLATQSTDGLLSKDDKIKIDNMEELTDLLGNVIPNKPIDNIGAIGISDKLAREDHIHPLPDIVTTTTDGLMTSVDKVKLDNLTAASGNYLSNSDIGVKVASLVSGKVPISELPAIAINDIFTVNLEADKLALVAEQGDVVVVTDTSKSYILKQSPASDNANWVELLSPLSPVQSVAGRVGNIVLTKNDVGLNNVDNTSDLAKPISTATQTALDLKLSKDNDTANNLTVNNALINTGIIDDVEIRRTRMKSTNITIVSGTNTIDLSSAYYFKLDASALAAGATFTIDFTNLQSSGFVAVAVIECKNFGGKTVTWPTGIQWPGGTAPTLTTTGVDIISVLIDETTLKANISLGKDVK